MFRMRRMMLTVTLITIGFGLSAGTVGADTLRATMADAYRNSDLLEQNRYLLRVSDEGVAQQMASLRPVVNFVAQSRYDATTATTVSSLNLTAELLLFNNGGRLAALSAARQAVLSTRQQLVGLEQQVLLDAVNAYMNVWRDLQVVQVRESNVRVLTQQFRAAQDRFDVGEDTRTDVAFAEAQLAAARSALAAAYGGLEISRELFTLSIGRAPGNLAGPGNLPTLPESVAADALTRQIHPDILALQFQVAADGYNLAEARADYGPSISLQAQTGRTYGGFNEGENSSVTLSLTQPIYRGGQLASLERVALARLSASQFALNQQVRVNLQNVGNAYTRLRIASAQSVASDQQIRAAQLAFDGVREEASLGARTILDVLDAEQDLLDARIGRIEAQTDIYTASYNILATVGLLTVDHLELPVPRYDPANYSNAYSGAPPRLLSPQGERLDAVLDRMGRD